MEALATVRLERATATAGRTLSGGQRQRVALARALVNRPRGAAARRAARRPRPQAARADAGRAQGDPARGRHHVRLRHPRPGGGADDERPDRRVQRAAGSSRSATPAEVYEQPATRVRGRLRRHVEPARGPGGAQRCSGTGTGVASGPRRSGSVGTGGTASDTARSPRDGRGARGGLRRVGHTVPRAPRRRRDAPALVRRTRGLAADDAVGRGDRVQVACEEVDTTTRSRTDAPAATVRPRSTAPPRTGAGRCPQGGNT